MKPIIEGLKIALGITGKVIPDEDDPNGWYYTVKTYYNNKEFQVGLQKGQRWHCTCDQAVWEPKNLCRHIYAVIAYIITKELKKVI